jgi:hypothetical protein
MNNTSTRALLTAACLAAMTMAAGAAPLRADAVRHLSPGQRAAVFKAAMAEQAARSRASMPAPEAQDITPPELKKISVTRQATATANGQQVVLDLTVVDDWSGLEWGEVTARRVDGNDVKRIPIPGTFGGRSFSGKLAMEFPAALPAGEWKIVDLYGADANGNNYWYDETSLAAFGNLTFKVSPMPSADWAQPELRSGKILTPVVYVTRPAKGTDSHPAVARVELKVVDGTDQGTSGVSGVRRAELFFCSEAPWGQCFSAMLSQPDSIPYGTREAVFLVGQTLDQNFEAGDYVLSQVMVEDWAGMSRYYDRANTDFSQIFGSGTKITLKR